MEGGRERERQKEESSKHGNEVRRLHTGVAEAIQHWSGLGVAIHFFLYR